MEDLHCGAVDADDNILVVYQHKSLAHIARYLFKLIAFALKLFKLRVYLPVLPVYACQQRGQFLIRIVFQRMVKVKFV